MEVKLIWAQARKRVIGNAGVLPWHLPEDLAHFKAHTLGCPVIMGRKTWDGLPPRFKPLPGRLNLVLTRSTDWAENAALRASSLPQALSICEQKTPTAKTAWVIGGAEVFALALPCAVQAVVTEIDADFAGDAFAPVLGAEWREVAREARQTAQGLRFSFVSYLRPP